MVINKKKINVMNVRNAWSLIKFELKERLVEVTYRIRSIIRDRSLNPGLKSSLLKLSLLVNGSMPTCSKTDDQNTQPAHKLTWHFLCPPKGSLGIVA